MAALGRVCLKILATLLGFLVGVLFGFYGALALGANIHDATPIMLALTFGAGGGVVAFSMLSDFLRKRDSR